MRALGCSWADFWAGPASLHVELHQSWPAFGHQSGRIVEQIGAAFDQICGGFDPLMSATLGLKLINWVGFEVALAGGRPNLA